jgi:hypothetical protein
MEDLYVITETDTTLLGAVVPGAARLATVGQHRTCHIYMNATVPVPVAAVTRVVAAARPATGSQQWELSRTQARQRRRPIPKNSSLTCSVTNRPRLLGVVAYTQKRYSVLLGGTTQMNESPWLNDQQRGEAPRLVIWLCVKNIFLVPLTIQFEVQGSNHLQVESYPHHSADSH